MMIRRFILFVRHVVAYGSRRQTLEVCMATPSAHGNFLIFLFDFKEIRKKVLSTRMLYSYDIEIPIFTHSRGNRACQRVSHNELYQNSQTLFQSMIACNILTEYVWEFQSKVALLVCC